MTIFFITYIVVIGFVLGSFLNVVSLRFNTGKSLSGRSMCFSCSKKLAWYELIPLFSWLLQGGRCRGCSSRIPAELLISEIFTGIIFGLIAMRGFFSNSFILDMSYITSTMYLLLVFCVLVVILFYDIRHKIIPDQLSATFATFAFVGLFFFTFSNGIFGYTGFHVPDIWQLIAGLLVPLPFVLIWLFSKGRLIGLGDPKLMVGMGWLFGISFGFSAVLLSFYLGALYTFALFLIQKILKKNLVGSAKKGIMKTEVPFAPFLIFGTLITLLSGLNILIW